MKDTKFIKIEEKDFDKAIYCVKVFSSKYPDHIGFQEGAVFSADGQPTFYVYQTKTQFVVRYTGA